MNGYCFDFHQATTVSVEDSVGSLIISAVYLPPKHIVKQEKLETFYNILGQRFIAGSDYNSKHTAWGSLSLCPEDEKSTKQWNTYTYDISLRANPPTGPMTEKKLSELLDFCVTKGIPSNSAAATSSFDLSSDHSPVIVDLTTHALPTETPPR
jgi:hypothetical protein